MMHLGLLIASMEINTTYAPGASLTALCIWILTTTLGSRQYYYAHLPNGTEETWEVQINGFRSAQTYMPLQASHLSFWLVSVPSLLNCYRSRNCRGQSPADCQQQHAAFSPTQFANYLNDLWSSGVGKPECETLGAEPSMIAPQLLTYTK